MKHPLLFGGIVALVVSFLSVRPLVGMLVRGGLQRRNYRSDLVPTALGLLLPIVASLATISLLLMPASRLQRSLTTAQLLVLIGMSLIGFVDDAIGDGKERGLGGHMRSLCRGNLTTGGLKLLYGGVLAVCAALVLPWAGGVSFVLTVGLVALGANVLNLFDLRPGRALKAFLGGVLAIFLAAGTSAGPILIVVATAVSLLPLDLRGQAMLGDTGANALGGALGLYAATSLGIGGQIIVLLIFGLLHVYAELSSITRLIEGVRLLRWLDELGTRRS